MPTFRDREKIRLSRLKRSLFTGMALQPGLYRGIRRNFALHEDHAAENLWSGIREPALNYFHDRKIKWHYGVSAAKADGTKRCLPSNHLCCSQSHCVNSWFPFASDPDGLAELRRVKWTPLVGPKMARAKRESAWVCL